MISYSWKRSFLETKAYSVAHTSVEVSKRSLVREWAKIPHQHYRAAVTKSKEDLIWLLMYIEKWGYWLILIYISYYTVLFFVVYRYLDLLIKQKRSLRTFCLPCIVPYMGTNWADFFLVSAKFRLSLQILVDVVYILDAYLLLRNKIYNFIPWFIPIFH